MNKFKVGDRVRVYYADRSKPLDTDVITVNGDFLKVRDVNGYYPMQAHYKQCRKLKKKQRLEGWVNVYDHGIDESIIWSTKEKAQLKIARDWNYLRTVKMREVRE